MKGSSGPTRTSSFVGSIPLSELEPFAVAVTLLSGAFALLGVSHGAGPPLVLLCWFLFVSAGGVDHGPSPGSTPRGPRRRWRSWAPAFASAAAGWTIELLAGLPVGSGTREFLLVLLSAGLAYALLPADRTPPLCRSGRHTEVPVP